jgi:hypothetical protein
LTDPNNSLSINSRGNAAQLILIKRPLVARAEVVDQVGDDFLARAALAGDENGTSLGATRSMCARPPSWRGL